MKIKVVPGQQYEKASFEDFDLQICKEEKLVLGSKSKAEFAIIRGTVDERLHMPSAASFCKLAEEGAPILLDDNGNVVSKPAIGSSLNINFDLLIGQVNGCTVWSHPVAETTKKTTKK
jgi:hypothetical protein